MQDFFLYLSTYLLDRHNVMPVSWSYPRHFVWFCEKKEVIYLLFFVFFCFFGAFLFCFRIRFLIRLPIRFPIRFPIWVLLPGPSDNLISLSYSMPVFSANLFGLFFKLWNHSGKLNQWNIHVSIGQNHYISFL